MKPRNESKFAQTVKVYLYLANKKANIPYFMFTLPYLTYENGTCNLRTYTKVCERNSVDFDEVAKDISDCLIRTYGFENLEIVSDVKWENGKWYLY